MGDGGAVIAELPLDLHLSPMPFGAHQVSPEVAERQARRYRQMTSAERLARANALSDLAWDAVTTGVRLQHHEVDDANRNEDGARAVSSSGRLTSFPSSHRPSQRPAWSG